MSRELIIGGTTFEFPEQGDDPTWGEEVVDFAEAVADVLNTITSVDDVLLTSFNLTNNQTTFADIDGLRFSKTSVRSARIVLDIYITTSTEELQETLDMNISYKNIEDEFRLAVVSVGDESGVTFNITSNGQVQYKTTNVSGTSYAGTLTFKASAIVQQ
jgi:hypothetical protein